MIFGTEIPKIQYYPGDTYITSYTVDTGTDIFTCTAHGTKMGDAIQFGTDDTRPSPLLVNVRYYVIYIDENSFKVAATRTLAYAGTAIDITTAGSGTKVIRRLYEIVLTNAKILKDEAAPDLLMHKSDISGHKSYVNRGQHWDFEVLIHLFKEVVAGQAGTYDSDIDSSDFEFAAVHGFIDDDPVTLSGAIPSEFLTTTIYYVNYIDTDTINLALTPDGASISMAGGQDGSVTVTKADHLITYQTLYQMLGDEVGLWRHKDGYPFMQVGTTDPTSLGAEDGYAKFRLESLSTVYITGEHGTEDVLKLVFKSIDYVDLYWNAGAF